MIAFVHVRRGPKGLVDRQFTTSLDGRGPRRTTIEPGQLQPELQSRRDRQHAPQGGLDRDWTILGRRATIVAMTTAEPLRSVRDHLSEVVDRVQRHHERVIITRNGHDAAVVISPHDLAQLEETIAVLSDHEALADIREADAAYDRGDVIRGVEAVRRLHRD